MNRLSPHISALNKSRRQITFLLLYFLFFVSAAFAQTDGALQLNLRRDFGTGIGANIQGTFSLRAEGPADLERVVFLLDDEPMAEANAAPFRYQFHTDAYPPGVHTFSAVGYTAVGQELSSNTITRNIMTGAEATRGMVWMIVPVLVLIVGGSLLTGWIAKRGQRANPETAAVNGAFGGTICPKCKRPFARHWWGLNIIVGKYDRCPHCGKWSVVQRVHPDILVASLDAMRQADTPTSPPADEADARQRRLDDSRYEN
ncbi:MAG: hypothetical protein IPM39_04005 [Chloroflexi bacterium]|nr:hypothetical protein [Chloroflexota bacterium]